MTEPQYQIYAKFKSDVPEHVARDVPELSRDEYRPQQTPMPHDNIEKFVNELRANYPLFDIQYRIIPPPDPIGGQEIQASGDFGPDINKWLDGD